jgi:hypothetical protein
LLSGHLPRLLEAVFGGGSEPIPGLPDRHLALDTEQFGDIPARAASRLAGTLPLPKGEGGGSRGFCAAGALIL